MTAGIREEIDLDVTAALRRVAELETAVNRATKTNLKIDTGTAGTVGLATKELATYESVLGKAGVSTGNLLAINRNLATSFGSGVAKPAAEAEVAVRRFGGVIGDARTGLLGLASTAASKVNPALGEAGKIAGETAGKFSGAATAAVGIAGAATVVGLALAKMAVDGIGKFVELAEEVRTVQRVTGATAEDASKLNAVFRVMGINADTGSAAIFKLSRNVANHADVLAHDGIEIDKNSRGQTDLIATLGSVGEAYQKAGKGADGNRVLFDAFGRSGLALAPILALDKKQLEEFVAAAEKHHEILTQDDLDKARAYKIAQHELTESFEGMERELGSAVIPALTDFFGKLTAAAEGADTLGQNVSGALDHIGGFGSLLSESATGVGGFSGALDLLGGNYKKAFEESIPFGRSLADLVGANDDVTDAARKHVAQMQVIDVQLKTVANTSGLTDQRLHQLADTMGIDLATATTDEIQKLDEAAVKLNAAVTPTQRLADVTGVLESRYSTTKENVDAFGVALDAALGSYMSAEEATIRVRQRMDELTKAIHDGVQKGQTHQQYLDDITLKTDAVTQAIEAEVKALVTAGTVDAGSAAEKQALVSRLLAVADTYNGPVADALRAHAYRIASIPQEKTTTLKADTKPAKENIDKYVKVVQTVLDGVTADTETHGRDAGHKWDTGMATGLDAAIGVVIAAATRVANAPIEVTRAIHKTSSPSKVGIELGGFFVEGVALGLTQKQTLLYDAAFAQAHGLTSVYRNASQVTATESLKIFSALDKVRDAQTRLHYIEADQFATTEQLTRARLELAAAEEDVNSATFEALDSTQALTDALAEQQRQAQATRDGFDSMIGAYNSVIGVRSAQRALDQAEKEEAAAKARQAALPGEIAAAEKALADARTAAAQVTASEALAVARAKGSVADAEQRLANLRSTSPAETLALFQAQQDAATAAAHADAVKADPASTAADITVATLQAAVAADKYADAQKSTKASTDDLTTATLEVQVAQEAYTKAQADAVGPTQDVTAAQKKLTDLQTEAAGIATRVRDATEAVTDAQLRLVSSEQALADSGTALTGTHAELVAMLTSLGTAAGLTRAEIDALVTSVESATNVARDAGINSNGTPGRLVNTTTGRPAFTGPRGEGGTGAPRGVPGETSWVMPDGTRVWYVPNQNIDPGNVAALGRTSTATTGTGRVATPLVPNVGQGVTAAGQHYSYGGNAAVDPAVVAQIVASLGGIRTTSVTVNPKTAVYDMKQTVATVRTMELLGL